jgi:hypothetical protein
MSKLVGLTELAAALADHIMTTAEKTKLSGIEAGANNYVLPKAAADTLGGVKVGTNLSIDPSTGVLSATDTTYTAATTETAGLMSAADKAKLDSASKVYTDTGDTVLTTAKALSDAYNALAALISAKLKYEVAQTCPAVGDAADNTVYLVPDAGGTTCTEYLKVTVGGTARMEVIGSTGITVDPTITSGGQNPVEGGAIYTALAGKQDTLTQGSNITISGNTISATDTTYSNATTSAAGLMSAADKTKLDSYDELATTAQIETAFGLSS